MASQFKYTYENIVQLNYLYSSGLNRDKSCELSHIRPGSFTYLMRKYGFKIRSQGFQKNNKIGKQFIKGLWHTIQCFYCKKDFDIADWAFRGGRKYCSASCRSKNASILKPGAANPNWKGGITSQSEKLRSSTKYKKWRKLVYRRDKFTCQSCGQHGGRLNAHHIQPIHSAPELITSINNGITLCKNCHLDIHKKMHHRGRHR